MKFIDPFSAECEFCKTKSLYPVRELLSYKSTCKECGEKLVSTPARMNSSIRSHKISIWPMMFLWEVFDKFNLDFDKISDQEFGQITHLCHLKKLIERFNCDAVLDDVLEINIMNEIRESLDPDSLESYSLRELALLSNPEKPLDQ